MIKKEKSKSTQEKKANNLRSYTRSTPTSKDLIANRELMKTQETKIVNQMIAHFKKLNSKKTKTKKSNKKL